MDDFCIFILTHGRANNVITYKTLIRGNFTGKIYIVIDDEDDTASDYYKRFGDKVLMFSKEEIAKTFDEGDNFKDRRCIVYARNACFDLAKKVGCKYFMQLDDDYVRFEFRSSESGKLLTAEVKNIEKVFSAMLTLYKSSKCLTMAMSQGGDYIGGVDNIDMKKGYKRKAMNSLLCSTERPFKFFGRLNEDVNFYTNRGRCGDLIFSIYGVMLQQKQTQSGAGGMTDIYMDNGTYVKSFYSVMYAPSCVKIGQMGNTSETMRIHHQVKWNNTVPKILTEAVKNGR